MSGVSLDKEGEVVCPVSGPNNNVLMHWRWSDLSPFEQGYGGAMTRELYDRLISEGMTPEAASQAVAFRNWAPETLAAIRKDCAAFVARYGGHRRDAASRDGAEYDGGRFWTQRQNGQFAPAFPPLTPILSEDGKVRFQ